MAAGRNRYEIIKNHSLFDDLFGDWHDVCTALNGRCGLFSGNGYAHGTACAHQHGDVATGIYKHPDATASIDQYANGRSPRLNQHANFSPLRRANAQPGQYAGGRRWWR